MGTWVVAFPRVYGWSYFEKLAQQKVLQVLALKPGSPVRSISEFTLPERRAAEPVQTGKAGIGIHHAIDLVAIGTSTGGPPALQLILSAFEQKYPFAIVISQHMPAGFTKAFADRLNRSSFFDVKEAEDGDLVLPGRAQGELPPLPSPLASFINGRVD